MNLKRCKCGKNVIFAKVVKRDGSEGKVPLDPAAPVYYVCVDVDSDECTAERAPSTNASGYYVSHFTTCSAANEFSGGKR